MTQLYRCFDVDEETPVQFLGVHPLRWRPEWGEPTAMFREAHEKETLKAAMELPEVQALVEASRRLYDICYWLTRDQIAKLGDEAMISAGYGLAYDQMADDPGRVNLKWARDALAPFDVEK